MPTIKYPKNPNIDTAFVEQEGGTKNRALMIAPQDISTLELPNNPNSTKGYITVDGQKQRVILTADITGGGGGGSALPDQTGHSGEFLTTDGTDASWAAVNALQNTANGTESLSVGKATTANNVVTVVNSDAASVTTGQGSAVVGSGAVSQARDGVALGRLASVYSYNGEYGIAIGGNSSTRGRSGINIGYGAGSNGGNGDYGIAIGREAQAKQNYSIQLGNGSNNEAGTFYVASYYNSANVNYKLMDADGTIPTDRLVHAINKYSSMPTASADYLGQIAQFTGTTDATYTHGYIYECVSDGGNPATYSWTAVQLGGGLQNTATGTNSLTLLGTATTQNNAINIGAESYSDYGTISIGKGSGKRYMTNPNIAYGVFVGQSAVGGLGTADCRWSVVIGDSGSSRAQGGTVIGASALVTAKGGIAIGQYAQTSAQNAICLNASGTTRTNSDANTFKIANQNGNFEMMDANGNLPADRLASTTGLADGNYRLRLTMASGVPTLSWVAE